MRPSSGETAFYEDSSRQARARYTVNFHAHHGCQRDPADPAASLPISAGRSHRRNGPEAIVGIKNVTVNEPFFSGHFPDFPVMPGVLIVEAMAQTAGVLVLKKHSGPR